MKHKLLHTTFVLLLMFYLSLEIQGNLCSYSDSWSSQYFPILDNKYLDANSIRTVFRNNDIFNTPFEYPKGSGSYVKLFSGLWIGAEVGDDTLVSVSFNTSEFAPGYTDSLGIPHGIKDSLFRIYKLTAGVNNYNRMSWPNSLLGNSNQGAPVYYDFNSQSWKPLDYATQTMFYVYTDSYSMLHNNPAGSIAPLKADIKQINFAFDMNGPLGQVAFSQFTIINRSNDVWHNTYFSIVSHDAVGDSSDDRCGCDSALWLSYSYNHAPIDPIYGSGPPAIGLVILRGAVRYTGNNNDTVFLCNAEQRKQKVGYKNLGMSVFNWFRNDTSTAGAPTNYRQSYRFMSGNHKNGAPIIHPNGYVTKYIFSGDPVTGSGWLDTQSADQRLLPSTGPTDMMPGDTQIIVIGQIAARGSTNTQSVGMLRTYSVLISRIYYYCFEGAPIGIEGLQEIPYKFILSQNYPNPFNPITKIRFFIPLGVKHETSNVKLIIYDILGREVATLVPPLWGGQEGLKPGNYEVEWDGSNFASGVYFYKLEVGDALTHIGSSASLSITKKMVLIK